MKEGPDIARLASLVGDPTRAGMLMALMSGMALTAGELAREAAVTPQTASAHLSALLHAGLLTVEVQGRHRYMRLAGPEVATALEGFMGLAAQMGRLRTRPGPRDGAMRHARVCYDHLAGAMGVRLHDAFMDQRLVVATADGLGLSPRGAARLVADGIDIAPPARSSPPLCRSCLDWSERRHHLAGRVGAALLAMFIDRGWAHRDTASRAVLFSAAGQAKFEAFLVAGPDCAAAE
jgi:DNA-binding transcriptional ArsR family regulator